MMQVHLEKSARDQVASQEPCIVYSSTCTVDLCAVSKFEIVQNLEIWKQNKQEDGCNRIIK